MLVSRGWGGPMKEASEVGRGRGGNRKGEGFDYSSISNFIFQIDFWDQTMCAR